MKIVIVGVALWLGLALAIPRIEVSVYLRQVSKVEELTSLEFLEASAMQSSAPERLRGEYIVRSGDTVCDIASRWQFSCNQVQQANAGRYEDQFSLPIGLRLYLPLDGTSGRLVER